MMGPKKCYGSTVMGERGQVVIPAEAREELDIQPGEKLMVFGNPDKGIIFIFKSELMTRMAEVMMRKANFFGEIFKNIHKGFECDEPKSNKGPKGKKDRDDE